VNGAKRLGKFFFTPLNRKLDVVFFFLLWVAAFRLRDLFFLDFLLEFLNLICICMTSSFGLSNMLEEVLVMANCLTNCFYLRQILAFVSVFVTLDIDELSLVLHVGLSPFLANSSIILVRYSLWLTHLFLWSTDRWFSAWHYWSRRFWAK
jgi:hypothetical protein